MPRHGRLPERDHLVAGAQQDHLAVVGVEIDDALHARKPAVSEQPLGDAVVRVARHEGASVDQGVVGGLRVGDQVERGLDGPVGRQRLD